MTVTKVKRMSIFLQYLRTLVLLIAAEQSVIVLSDPDKLWIKGVLNYA
jgi:hypothetical protein